MHRCPGSVVEVTGRVAPVVGQRLVSPLVDQVGIGRRARSPGPVAIGPLRPGAVVGGGGLFISWGGLKAASWVHRLFLGVWSGMAWRFLLPCDATGLGLCRRYDVVRN